jgi:hypothetical protein
VVSSCEVGPMAKPDMNCPIDGTFCLLDVGICNSKMGFHTGICTSIPMVCTEIYAPVW